MRWLRPCLQMPECLHVCGQVLLLDAETTAIVATVYSQSEILEREVFLVQRLDIDRGEQLFHLKVRQLYCQRLHCRLCKVMR